MYQHSVERSTELLRKALPLMSKQAAALHPASYAIWYAYVGEEHSALHQALDAHLAAHGSLDEAATEAMYRRFLATPQDLPPAVSADMPSEQMAEELQRLLDGMQASAAAAGDETARYGHSLQQLSAALGPNQPSTMPPALDMVREHTLQMQSALTQLQRQLAESQREINTLRDEVRSARQDSLIDALTGLGNRRAFDRQLSTCLATNVAAAALDGAAGPPPLCLMMIDIDRFKRVNDTYGHAFGDQVLRAVAQVLKAVAPEGSLAARVGGEEFALLLPAMALAPARELAEKLRVTVAASRIRRKGSNDAAERITISLGLAQYGRRGGSDVALGEEAPTEFIERADRALYAAKQGGRDRVELAV